MEALVRMRIPYPRIFAVFLVVLVTAGVVSTTLAVTQDEPDAQDEPSAENNWGVTGTKLPSVPQATPSDAEVARAEAVLRSSDEYAAIAGDAEFSVIAYAFDPLPGHPEAMGLNVRLNDPIDAGGPWYWLKCQKTRILVGEAARWENVHLLSTVVDPGGEILQIGALSPGFFAPEEDASQLPEPRQIPEGEQYNGPATVIDVQTMDVLGSADHLADLPEELRECPPGLEDD